MAAYGRVGRLRCRGRQSASGIRGGQESAATSAMSGTRRLCPPPPRDTLPAIPPRCAGAPYSSGTPGGRTAADALERPVIVEQPAAGTPPRVANDLRAWLARVEALGQLKRLEGAHWDLELGGIAELMHRRPKPSALLFDAIPGYPRGHRVLTNMLGTVERLAVTTEVDATV